MNRHSPSSLAQKTYDSIIIGSGLGGLTTAALLAKAGKKVLVLERHYVPGGFTHTFKRSGFEWDVGVHYVGQVGNKKSLMSRVFDHVTGGQLEWAPMGDIYDRAVIDGDRYDFVVGLENQIQKTIGYFPSEEEAIRKYYKLISGMGLSAGLFFGERSMPPFLSKTVGFFMRRAFYRYSDRTTYEVLSELTQNKKLIAYLCTQCGDYGLPPKKSSFGIHAALVEHYLDGGNYPCGGASQIYKTILSGFEQNGGTLAVCTEVKQILVEDGKAVGVKLVTGEEIRSACVVSNAGARNTFEKLLPPETELPANLKSDLRKIHASSGHVCLYIGLDASDETLKLPKYNHWIYNTYDFDKAYEETKPGLDHVPPLAYISCPSAKDPLWAQFHPGKSTIQVIAACPYDWVRQWEDTSWNRREEAYKEFKEDFKRKLLQKLYQVLPQVEGHVVVCEISTPLSTKHFSHYQEGEIYGLEHSPARFRLPWLRIQTPIKKLFLTGQDVMVVGVGSALFSGLLTASVILKRNLLWGILRKQTKPETTAQLPETSMCGTS